MDVLADDVTVTILLAGIVDGQDVRMLEHSDQMGFGQEHLACDARPVLIAAGVDVVDLDRDVASVVRIVREINGARAAATHLLDDRVFADLFWRGTSAVGGGILGHHRS